MGYKYLPKKNGKIKKIENAYKGRIDIYKKIISSWKMPNCFDDGTDSTFGGGSKGLGPVMSFNWYMYMHVAYFCILSDIQRQWNDETCYFNTVDLLQ